MSAQFTGISHSPNPGDLFLASPGSSYDYGDLWIFSQQLLEKLRTYDIRSNQAIGLCAHSCDELIFIIGACWLQQIPFVCFNPESKLSTLKSQLQRLEIGLIISDNPELSTQSTTIPMGTFDLSVPSDGNQNINFEDQWNPIAYPEKKLGYFFTSGTSGSAKTVPLKRRQMIVAAQSSAQNLRPFTNEYWLLCMPLHHIGGISVILRSLLYGSAIFRLDRFHNGRVRKLLSSNKRIVAASLVPTMYKRLLDKQSFTTHRKLQAILLGGGPISSSMLKKSIRRDIPLITSYGMTETCAQIAANPIFKEATSEQLQSVGKILGNNKIEVRDRDNQPLAARQSGTIWLKGPQVFDGYTNEPKKLHFDQSGWFNTGDFGHLDDENNLYIEARRTDLIISGGENVSPFEVEAALQKIGNIAEAAVLGKADEEWGQKVVAVVVAEDNNRMKPNAIRQELKKELEPYKIPKEFIYKETLPRTNTGKIKRKVLHALIKKSQSK